MFQSETIAWRYGMIDKGRRDLHIKLAEISKKPLHLGTRVLIALTNGGLNTLGEDGLCILCTIVLGQCLRIHLVTGDVVRVGLD